MKVIYKIKLTFIKLTESNWIVQAKGITYHNLVQNDKPEQLKCGSKGKKENSGNINKRDKKKRAQKENNNNDNNNINITIEENKINSQISSSSNIDNNSLLFNTKTNTHSFFFFNYPHILSKIKTQFIIDFINQKISIQTGLVTSFLLSKNQITSF